VRDDLKGLGSKTRVASERLSVSPRQRKARKEAIIIFTKEGRGKISDIG